MNFKIIILFGLLYYFDCKEFYLKREYSLSKPFAGSWDFIGASVMTNDYIRLTHNMQSQYGGISNLYPNTMIDWEVHINFKIHGNNGHLFGDGFAFWYISKSLKPGPIYGNENYFKGLAVFVDTYSNHNGAHHHEHPYISAMVNNGTQNYDHDTDGTHTQLAGCSVQLRNKGHDTMIAVRYVENKLTVSHDVNNEMNWTQCFAIENVRLPLGYYFGVSAATGDLADNHDIISIKSYEVDVDHSADPAVDLYNIEPFAERVETQRDHVDGEKPSVGWRILKGFWFGFTVVACCAIVIFACYLYRQNEHQKKRLY